MKNVTEVEIRLSEQNLAEFLEDDSALMTGYCGKLTELLKQTFPNAEINVSYRWDWLTDRFIFDFSDDDFDNEANAHFEVESAMDETVSDWSWANV